MKKGWQGTDSTSDVLAFEIKAQLKSLGGSVRKACPCKYDALSLDSQDSLVWIAFLEEFS